MSKKKPERPKYAHVYLIDGKKYYYTNTVKKYDNCYLGFGILPKLANLNNTENYTFYGDAVKVKTPKPRYFIDGMKCCYCENILSDKDCTREHILPRSKGGTLILPACKMCNGEKRNMLISEYISFLIKKNKDISEIDKLKISNAIHISITTKIS